MKRGRAAIAELLPMQLVVKRTGLTPDVLRVWERRYGAVRPTRSPGNRRLYTEADVARLRLLARGTRQGRTIGQLAALDDKRLRDLVAADESAPARPHVPASEPEAAKPFSSAGEAVDEALAAVRRLDAPALDEVLARAAISLPRAVLLEDVLAPLLHRIGNLWHEGELRVAHEHMASAVVRGCLAQLRGGGLASGPAFVAATPSGQRHEFGALLAALEAEAAGYAVAYLGPDLPAEEVAAAAAALKATVVGLSLVFPADDPRVGAELERLRRLLGRDVAVLVGGAAAPAYAASLERARMERVGSLKELRARLLALRRPAAAG